jgi:CRP/FNR family cyclic AMP-dependent transcriptional regulator
MSLTQLLSFEKDLDLCKEFSRVWQDHIRRSPSSYLSLFTPDEVFKLASYGRKRILTNGQVLYAQGDVAKSLAVVLYGSLSVVYTDPETGDSKVMSTVQVGGTVGEMALITDGRGENDVKRNATVKVDGDHHSEVMVMDYDDFTTFIFEQLSDGRGMKIRTMMRDMVISRLYPREPKPWDADTKRKTKNKHNHGHGKGGKDISKDDSDIVLSPNAKALGQAGRSHSAEPTLETNVRPAPANQRGGSLLSILSNNVLPSISRKPVKTDDTPADPELQEEKSTTNAQSQKLQRRGHGDPENIVTILNMDSLLECLWQTKFSDKASSQVSKKLQDDSVHLAHTAIYQVCMHTYMYAYITIDTWINACIRA